MAKKKKYRTRCGPRGRFKSGPRKGHCKPSLGSSYYRRKKSGRKGSKRRCVEWAPYSIGGRVQKRCHRYAGSKPRTRPAAQSRAHGPVQRRRSR